MKFVHPYLRPTALIGALCAIAMTAVVDAQRSERRYGVAVVRADGTIIPFAEYDRGRWRALWSGIHRRSYQIPITLDAVDDDWWGKVDPASVWQLWKQPGISDGLTVTGIRPVSTPCSASVGLTTDYRPAAPPPPPDVAPYPKAGLATSAGIAFQPIAPVERGSAAWQRVNTAIERSFHGLELRRLFGMRWGHPIPNDERRLAPVTLNVVLHVPGSRFHYFEATREYRDPDPPDDAPPCGLVTYVSGFLWQDGRGELVPVSINTLVSYCHLEEAIYLWPLGVIREGGHDYWVVQTAGWTGEAYGVIEPDEEKGIVRDHLWHTAGQCGRR
jgi:hypothetical protein